MDYIKKLLEEGLEVIKSSTPSGHPLIIDQVNSFKFQKWVMNCISLLKHDAPDHVAQIKEIYKPEHNLITKANQIFGVVASAYEIFQDKKNSSIQGKSPTNGDSRTKEQFEYDLFLSHAGEDNEIAEKISDKLLEKGIKVWYDKNVLTVGDSLRRSIDAGLSKSRFGVVILSRSFFEKEWSQKELDALVSKEDGKNKVILPVWHMITKNDIQQYSPLLADKVGVSTDKGIEYVCEQIILAIKKENGNFK